MKIQDTRYKLQMKFQVPNSKFFGACYLVLVSFLWCLLLGVWSFTEAAFHDNSLVLSGKKNISYFVMHQLKDSYQSSSINVDIGGVIGEGRTLELFLMGYRSPYLLTNSSYQVGLLEKQRLVQVGGFSITGAVGMGGLYSAADGFSLCVDVGGILGLDILPSLKFSAPVIANVFSDGALVDYSAGITSNLAGKEVILGFKGNAMLLISGGSFSGFQNSFYGLVGLRMPL